MSSPAFDIVIPSIGEASLSQLLSSINNSSLIPANVFIVLRTCDSYEFNPSHYLFPIHILYSSVYGQVPQRQYGFSVTKSSIVIQMDADSTVHYDFFSTLLGEFCQLESIYGEQIALSPAYIDADSFLMFSTDSFPLKLSRKLYSSCHLLFPCGNLTIFGFNFPLNLPQNKIPSASSTYRSDWLPGGCVVHRSSNLITCNYYPFSGKAYAEDLFHSVLLSSYSIQLFVTYSTHIFTESHPRIVSLIDALHGAHIYFKTSKQFCRLTKSSPILSLLILLPYIKVIILSPFHLVKWLFK